jgi:hypothetical protein
MAAITGGSHSVGGLMGIVFASYLTIYIKRYAPDVYGVSDALGRHLLSWLPERPPILEELAGALAVMLVLWWVWGWVYHHSRFAQE